ncbi:hypothetical protein AGMMS49992_22840 [Clostridia bacterium]|nr:hypothetical protein AGMMS49992_22840 [Clostridia bacterium]
MAFALAVCFVVCAFALSALALDPVEIGAGMVYGSADVFADASCVGIAAVTLPDQTEVEILGAVDGAVRIAYYDPDTLIWRTGYTPGEGSIITLRKHLTPGPHYRNVHPDADVLDAPREDAVLLGRLAEGVDVEVYESTSEWVRVIIRDASGRRTLGWVIRSFIVPKPRPPEVTPISATISGVEPASTPEVVFVKITSAPTASPDDPAIIQEDPTASPTATASPEPKAPERPHSVTLNAPNPEKPTKLGSRPDEYAMSYGDYYNGVVGEYISYNPEGWVEVRIGTAVGYWPAAYVWIDAPGGMVPSAIPSASVAQMSTRLNVRSYPSTNAEVLAQFLTDQPLEVLAIRDDWAQVRVDDLIGYVARAYVVKMVNRYVDPNTIPNNPPFYGTFDEAVEVFNPASAPTSTPTPEPSPTPARSLLTLSAAVPTVTPDPTPSAAERLRPSNPPENLPKYALVNPASGQRASLMEAPSTNARVAGYYYKDVCVTIDAVYDAQWIKVSIGHTTGYIQLQQLDIGRIPKGAPNVYPDSLPRRRVKYTKDSPSLELFAAPNALADQLGSCSVGQTVQVLGISGSWSHIVSSGRIGYLRTENLD